MSGAQHSKRRVHVPRDMVRLEVQPWLSGRINRAIDLGRNRLLMAGALFLFAFLAISVRLLELAWPYGQNDELMQLPGSALAHFKRADIVDRNGVVIATNLQTASLEADTTEVPDAGAALKLLSEVLPALNTVRARKLLEGRRRYVVLYNDLTPRQQQAVNELGIPGLRFIRDMRRIYPQENLAAHAVGYVD
ncbi:MAG: penicillin-binding protein 2, partial [Pseudomonadota bacterium]